MGRRELLLGAGSRRDKLLFQAGQEAWEDLTTCDIEASHGVDVVCDLNLMPWPFDDESFDEVHAYEVLEHLGTQGDYRAFFGMFSELWRILRPEGVVVATCPSWNAMWAWGDPGHTRIISQGSLVFLDRDEYAKQVGVTPMSDYRSVWSHSFKVIYAATTTEAFRFVLRKEPDVL